MPVLKINDESIRQAAEVLSGGGLVAFPTETVYGLGADAFNRAAVAKIFEVKNRPRFDPLIVHIAGLDMLEKTADLALLDPKARQRLSALAENLWPGPLTLILPKQKAVPDLVTSGLPTVAVRLPGLEAAQKLITFFGGPVAAPSANPFGYISPTRAEHVTETLGDTIDLILDGGPSNVGVESTVLDISSDPARILRPGGVTAETIEVLIGKVAGPVAHDAVLSSPGLLKNHYAPRVPLSVYDNDLPGSLPDDPGSALLFFDGTSRDAWLSGRKTTEAKTITVLSEKGNMPEAAAKLFEILHDLDRPDIKRIHASLVPEEGLGIAINDRLRRAAADHSER